jgi:DNA-damage-inducible protein J
MVRARIEPGLKKKAEGILSRVGISSTEFIRLAYSQVVLRQGIPFEARIPNAETRKAIAEAREGRGHVYDSPDEFYLAMGRKK